MEHVIAIGDDRTDEDLFHALPASSLTIAVGPRPSRTKFGSTITALCDASCGPWSSRMAHVAFSSNGHTQIGDGRARAEAACATQRRLQTKEALTTTYVGGHTGRLFWITLALVAAVTVFWLATTHDTRSTASLVDQEPTTMLKEGHVCAEHPKFYVNKSSWGRPETIWAG
jgi:hypothetical protein